MQPGTARTEATVRMETNDPAIESSTDAGTPGCDHTDGRYLGTHPDSDRSRNPWPAVFEDEPRAGFVQLVQ